jgi:hypothetical protein
VVDKPDHDSRQLGKLGLSGCHVVGLHINPNCVRAFLSQRAFDRNAVVCHLIISNLLISAGLEIVMFIRNFFSLKICFLGHLCSSLGSRFCLHFSIKCPNYAGVCFPHSGEVLKERLRNTHLVGLRAVHYKETNEKALQSIGELVDKMDDDSVGELMLRLTRIRQKKELLIHLLHQTQEELDYFQNRGEKYEDPPLPRVAEEEDNKYFEVLRMLSEILYKTSLERARLERYRDRVVENGTEVAAITRGGL